jgi:hypothetical protein
MNQFNLALAEKEKLYGLDRAEFNDEGFVHSMRHVARELIKQYGRITTDDLRKFAIDHDIAPKSGHAWGAIFKGKEFEVCGMTKSKLVSNHARMIREWRLR